MSKGRGPAPRLGDKVSRNLARQQLLLSAAMFRWKLRRVVQNISWDWYSTLENVNSPVASGSASPWDTTVGIALLIVN